MGGAGPLVPGEHFGGRYHIIRLLGIGGMGAVYQAWDQTLEVAVAIKVIKPEHSEDPEAAGTLEKRFKRELLLARSVTHPHVVRIHDLGELEGVTYITMPYVQGSDLASVVKREGKLPVERALAIAKQIASGLAAAHKAGVVHRDLKPANIMVDSEGDALIMDFGIARSTTKTGLTMTVGGAVIGTIEYMAPEQARGEAVDQRADVYSFGLILNDILLGRRQTASNTSAVTELMARMQHAPPPLRTVDASIPEALDAIVTTCLQPDPAARFQTMADLLSELERLDPSGHPLIAGTGMTRPFTVSAPIAAARPSRTTWWLAAAAAVVVAGAGAGWVFRDRLAPASESTAAATGPPISLAILPFRNASGDATLDSLGSSLGSVLATELGQSPRLRTVPADRLNQVLQDLRIAPTAKLGPSDLGRVAEYTSARRVLWGEYTRFGDSIRIDATLQDLDQSRSVPLTATAPNDNSLPVAIGQIASLVQQELGRESPDILKDLKATAWKPSTNSFEALRLYNEGIRLTQQGAHQDAQKSFEAATKKDENFALALSGLAQSYAKLGYDTEAAQFSRRAMDLAQSLQPQEKYLISANHYGIVRDRAKAIEAYQNLAKASPNDAMLHFELAGLHEQGGQLGPAQEEFAQVVALDPKFAEGLLGLGRVEIRAGNVQGSLSHLNAALTLAIQLNRDETRGNALQAIGIAYRQLGRLEEAMKQYQASLEIKTKLGNKSGMASSVSEIAQVQSLLGQSKEAEKSYGEALKLRREIGDKNGTSIVLVNLASLLNDNLGRPDEALPLLREALQIRRDAGNPNGEAQVLNSIGSVYHTKGEFSEAQTYFERALEIREKSKVPGPLADTLHNLGETLANMGKYDQALAQYLRAAELRRGAGDKSGAAIESYSMGTIFDYQARYGAAIKSKEEALQAYRDLKQRDFWLGEILSGYGNSLTLAGRLDDAAKQLDEATTVGNEVKNPSLIAQTLRFQADRLYYSGDLNAANRLAEQAVQAAAKASDRSLTLLTQASAARTAAALQPSKGLTAKLATLASQADAAGLKALAVESSLHGAETLLKLNDRAGARKEAESALAKAELSGFRVSLAKARYLRAEALRTSGDAEASREYASALRLLDQIKGEDGNQNVLKRADLAAIHAECERWSKGR